MIPGSSLKILNNDLLLTRSLLLFTRSLLSLTRSLFITHQTRCFLLLTRSLCLAHGVRKAGGRGVGFVELSICSSILLPRIQMIKPLINRKDKIQLIQSARKLGCFQILSLTRSLCLAHRVRKAGGRGVGFVELAIGATSVVLAAAGVGVGVAARRGVVGLAAVCPRHRRL